MADLDGIVAKSTAVDGLTGEKGLDGYATIGPRFLSDSWSYTPAPTTRLLPELLARHPKLRQTYGSSWTPGAAGSITRIRRLRCVCLAQHRLLPGPRCFAAQQHPGRSAHLGPTVSSGACTKPPGTVLRATQLSGERRACEGLPYDLFAADPAAIEGDVRGAIARHGPLPHPGA